DAVAEKGVGAMAGAVDELIRKYDVRRLVLFLHRADRAGRQNGVRAELLETIDVRTVIELARQFPMSSAVTREKRDAHAVDLAEDERIARLAERRGEVALLGDAQPFHLVEA